MYSMKDDAKKYLARQGVLDPLRKSVSDTHIISLISSVTMDSEPQHFLQHLQGSLCVTTDDYLRREKQAFDDDEDPEECVVMMFQLIGQACLNQKAREVPPFRSSLSSSGIYLIVAKVRLIFWIGHDYYDNYLDQDNYNVQSELIHGDLFNKVLFTYEKA